MPGVVRILDHADACGIAMAVVTKVPRENAKAMLDGTGIADRFAAVVIGGELSQGKPRPRPNLTALEILGVPAKDAMTFDDSLAGVQSATAAGLHTFDMQAGLQESELRAAGARSVIGDFDDSVLWDWITHNSCTKAAKVDATHAGDFFEIAASCS